MFSIIILGIIIFIIFYPKIYKVKREIEEEKQRREMKEKFYEKFAKASNLANEGDADGQYDLGEIYFTGYEKYGIEGDYKKAFEYFKKAADKQHDKALNMLGFMYAEVYKNDEEAYKWYKKAMARGNKSAPINLEDVCKRLKEKGYSFDGDGNYYRYEQNQNQKGFQEEKQDKNIKVENEKNKISQLIYSAAKSGLDLNLEEITLNFNEIFEKKKQREESNHSYEIAMKRNIVFYIYKWDYSLKLLKKWISSGIPDPSIAKKQIDEIRENSIAKNIGDKIILKNGQTLRKDVEDILRKNDMINSETKRIDELEFNYKFACTRDNILFNLIRIIISNKQSVESVFHNINSDELLEYIVFEIEIYANQTLKNIKYSV